MLCATDVLQKIDDVMVMVTSYQVSLRTGKCLTPLKSNHDIIVHWVLNPKTAANMQPYSALKASSDGARRTALSLVLLWFCAFVVSHCSAYYNGSETLNMEHQIFERF
jgi:hypothetical protein